MDLSRKRLIVWIKQHPIIVPTVIFVVLCLVYGSSIPPFEGPDEAQHFAYVVRLAEGRGFPPQGEAAWETPIEQEAGQPPLYYLLASVPARFIDLGNPEAVYRPNPYFTAPLPRDVFDHDNRALHYPADDVLAGGWLALYLARTLTVSFGIGLIVAVYLLAKELVPDKPMVALATASVTAFTPQVIYLSGMVSNDIPAGAFSTLTLWISIRILQRGLTAKRAFWTGVTLGLAALCKINALILGLPILLTWLWLWRSGKTTLPIAIKTGFQFLVGLLITCGWWFARVWWLYGSPLGLGTHDLTPWAITNPEEQLADFFPRWIEVAKSYWIALGWGPIRPAGWVYTTLLIITLLALIGHLTNLHQKRSAHRLATYAILASGLFIAVIFLEYWMRRVVAPYGRLMYPVIGLLMVVLPAGWHKLHPRLWTLPTLFLLGLSLTVPFTLIQPAYTAPPFLDETETAELSNTRNWFFGQSANEPLMELLTIEPLKNSTSAESVLPVQACWRTLAQADRNYTILLHIIGRDNGLVANRRAFHGQGHYPTQIWEPGRVFCDTMHIRIWEDLPTTLVYQLEVAIFDDETDTRLLAFDANGNPLAHTFFDQVRIISLIPATVPDHFVGDEPIGLVDFVVDGVWTPGRESTLTLHWTAPQLIPQDYQTFVHLRDGDENILQGDGPPLDGYYPTSWWLPETLITDERTISVPNDLPAGTYTLHVGWYDLTTGTPFSTPYNLGEITVDSE